MVLARGLALVIPLLQILAAIHAFKTGRETVWLWVIVAFPGVGTAAYFILEIVPDIRRGSLRDAMEEALDSWIPGRRLRRLQERLSTTDTVANRQALADYLLTIGRAAEAVPLFQECRVGHFKEDPELTLGLARAHFLAGSPEEARDVLRPLVSGNPARVSPEAVLLQARVLESLGKTEEAESAYRKAVFEASGLEADYRQSVFFARTERREDAIRGLEKVLARAKAGGKIFRRLEHEWVKRAKSGLAKLRA